MTKYITRAVWKTIDQGETMKVFCESNKYDLVLGIEEDKTPMSEPEDNLPVHVIPDE